MYPWHNLSWIGFIKLNNSSIHSCGSVYRLITCDISAYFDMILVTSLIFLVSPMYCLSRGIEIIAENVGDFCVLVTVRQIVIVLVVSMSLVLTVFQNVCIQGSLRTVYLNLPIANTPS